MMDQQEAKAIYAAGEDTVVETLCGLHTRIDALEKQHQVLGEKIAQLSINRRPQILQKSLLKRPTTQHQLRRKRKAANRGILNITDKRSCLMPWIIIRTMV